MASPKDVVVGVKPDQVDSSTSPGWTTGAETRLSDGGKMIYVRATSEISAYQAVVLLNDTNAVGGLGAVPATTTNDLTSKRIAFAQNNISSSNYGWVQQGGRPLVNLATNCAPNVPLYTTATAGALDDATISGHLVGGIIAETTISNATAVTINAAAGFIIGGAATGI